MKMKMASNYPRCVPVGLNLWLLAVFVQFSGGVMANEFLCQASQASHNELPVLEASCPIGHGVWGKKVPPKDKDYFWIQCGILDKPMSVAKAQTIYNKITTDVWMKPEDKGYRCLIGPYTDFAQASNELQSVQTLAVYKDAFLRAIAKKSAPLKKNSADLSSPAKSTKAVPQIQPKSKPAAAVSQSTQAPAIADTKSVQVRLQTILKGKRFAVPYVAENHNQFYMEHGKAWNRLSYASSKQVCQQLGMHLASPSEFKTLRNSGLMEKDNWPLQLPYWGKNKKGLFTDRAPNQLSGTSLLNVMCVK
ncbi:SPOR domain-containing protein [Vibrio azureus]|uniref:SPOR domain-containing protein n=1 Tax=Vibrio azureus NBRC 104587 TaxID=1219077 RepID=U3AVC0_9VIBR|nr:SPOR domain-containing protein [Vibrio azureus]AUI84984.1 SPOR domain-containing protein [Vibrio azureus]GAD77182.1 hypothetical protein VAZ01S_065_00060 [Vibrio azureus NBRC 104587]